jgi:3-oxoadipate enol-lactonase
VKGTTGGIAWEDRGDVRRPAILLIRPLGGSASLWGEFAGALERELRVVTFDALGSGRSSGWARVSTAALAADARAVLDARGIHKASLFGISLGGMVATRFAIDSPFRLASLVLASTAASGFAFERAGVRRASRFARCLARSRSETERCVVLRVLSHEFRAAHPVEAARIATVAAQTPSPRRTLVAHALAALRHDARAQLESIRAPTLVLAGDRDHLLGPDAGLALARGIAGATRMVIAGSGHDLTLERPVETAARVLAFVAGSREPALLLHSHSG